MFIEALQRSWWKGAVFSLAIGVLTLLTLFLFPNIYTAKGTISPISDEKEKMPALGAIASLGFSFSATSKVEDIEVLLKSKDLTVRVFQKYDLWPFVYPNRYDPRTRQLKEGWITRLLTREKPSRIPTEWDAIRTAEKRLKVYTNRRNNTLEVSFESPSPEGSAAIVGWYLEEAKNRLQEEALVRAGKNKKFIVEQIDKTVDALTRDRLFSIYGQEVEQEMLARNREQFGFKIVDAPRVPDRISKPHRGVLALEATFLSFVVYCSMVLLFGKKSPMGKHGITEPQT